MSPPSPTDWKLQLRGLSIFTLFVVFFLGAERGIAQEKLKLAVTTTMIADAARNIGGPEIEVTGLMGEGVDPHTYKASPGDVRILAAADLILFNGLHLEGRLEDVFENLAKRKPTFAITDALDRALLRQPPEFQGHYDPHVWFDVTLWSKAVGRLTEILAIHDPSHKELFVARLRAYQATLDRLHAWVNSEIASIPETSRVLVTAHDAFGYFGRAYNIEVHGIQGISTDSEASLRDMSALIDLLVSRQVKAVFVESSVSRKTIEALIEGAAARGHEVKVGGELFSDAMGPHGTAEGTYEGMVRHNVRVIVSGLTGKPSL